MSSELALVLVVAPAQIRRDAESVPAITRVATFGIGTLAVHANIRVDIAFIHIDTELSVRNELIARDTVTCIRSLQVLAFAASADSGLFRALVDINTIETIWREFKAIAARTDKRPFSIGTPLFTSAVAIQTFVSVDASLVVWGRFVAAVTLALPITDKIDTSSVDARLDLKVALIIILARDAIISKMAVWRALTLETSFGVSALSTSQTNIVQALVIVDTDAIIA
jgi:hypothetical protein